MTVSLYRYNAVLSDDKDRFQESETNQIITGSDSSVTATIAPFLPINIHKHAPVVDENCFCNRFSS